MLKPKRQWLALAFLLLQCLSVNVHGDEAEVTSSGETVSSDPPEDESPSCERLKKSLVYKQENAPMDISAVIRVVVEKLNRELSSVLDVEIGYSGEDIHRVVGDHYVQATVTRRSPTDPTSTTAQCFEVPFTILDTDECTLEDAHPMKHVCAPPSVCVNTIGSYECICPRGNKDIDTDLEEADADRTAWEKSLNSASLSSCPGRASTHQCCPVDAHTSMGKSCRSRFTCPTNPCLNHDCVSKSKCSLAASPLSHPTYSCTCPPNTYGNGHKCLHGERSPPVPKVNHKGDLTPETLAQIPSMCGCIPPQIDACADFPPCGKNQVCVTSTESIPKCVCAPGFIHHETYGCIDETPPRLVLNCNDDKSSKTILTQGDKYQECAVSIDDDNAEDYMRSLKISYSYPLLSGCLTKVGKYAVNYTVATPWTTPPFVQVTRRVIVQDLDECSLTPQQKNKLKVDGCGWLIPHCAEGAKCVNTVGSYECACPDGTEGDGYDALADEDERPVLPQGYKGGTGCTDTGPPVIQLLGPSVKTFKTCRGAGLAGVLSSAAKDSSTEEQLEIRKKGYELDIQNMIDSTSGAELCASSGTTSALPCVKAYDVTYKGEIDLTSQVIIGELERIDPPPNTDKDGLYWKVPYDVKDEAGNKATTQYRTIQVLELSYAEMEQKLRKEIQESLPKTMPTPSGGGTRKSAPKCPQCTCPQCPKIDCPPCPPQPKCPPSSSSSACDLLEQFRLFLSSIHHTLPLLFRYIYTCFFLCLLFCIFIYIYQNSKFAQYQSSKREEERSRIINESISYYASPTPSSSVGERTARHTHTDIIDTTTPSDHIMNAQRGAPPRDSLMSSAARSSGGPRERQEDVYSRLSPITPSRTPGSSSRGRRGDGMQEDGYPRYTSRTR